MRRISVDEQIIKCPTSQLFAGISNAVYTAAFNMLQTERNKYPSSGGIGSIYRDDELLMAILCRKLTR